MPVNLSVSMALESLREQCEIVNAAELRLTQERAKRNDLIRDARDNGIGYRAIMRLTGLSRDRLYTLVNSPRSSESIYPPVEPVEHSR